MDYDLDKLGTREFEHLTQALALEVLGSGVQVFGDGPDGGREAAFDGRYPHPSREPGQVWDGYGVLQAKFHQVSRDVGSNATWLDGQLRGELDRWSDPTSNRVRHGRIPEYLLVATNVRLSPAPSVGGVDKVSRLIDSYANKLSLKGWDLWYYDKICSLLDAHPGIRQTHQHLITAGDVLARMHELLSQTAPEFSDVVVGQVAKDMVDQQWVRLSESAHPENQQLALGQVAVDLPAELDRAGETQVVNAAQYVISSGDTVLRPSGNPERPQGVVLVGGPGQGKSTIGQLLCQSYRTVLLVGHANLPQPVLQLREQFLDDLEQIGLTPPAARRWPIHVRLSDYADKLNDDPDLSLLGYMTRMLLADADEPLTPVVLKRWMKAWPWFIVLDGLDEVADQRARDELLRKLQNFQIDAAQADADLFIVVTTRPQGYTAGAPIGDLPHLRLRALTPDEAISYARRLTGAQYANTPGLAREIITRLGAAAREAATAFLMQSPLQVTILSLLLERRPHAPRGRYELFQSYYTTVFDREAAKRTREATFLNQHRSHVNALHEWAGLTLQLRSERRGDAGAMLTVQELRDLARRRLDQEGFAGRAADDLARELVEVAEKRLVLLQRREDRFGFEVRSLQEFMAARALVTGKDKEVLDRLSVLAPSTHWRNTWLFAADRVFTDREGLRGDLLGRLKDADFADPLTLCVLPGARLAVDLLKDGVAYAAPVHAKALVNHALDLLPALPDRSTPSLANVLRPFAEPGNDVDRAVRDTAAAGSQRGLAALLVLACWADDPAMTGQASARIKALKAHMTSDDRLLAGTLAADYPARQLRDLAPRGGERLDETTLGERLRQERQSGIDAALTALESVRAWRERRGDLVIRRVDRSGLLELSRLDTALVDGEAVAALLEAAAALPTWEWPLASELYRILGAWLQRRPVGDRIIHPAIDRSPSR